MRPSGIVVDDAIARAEGLGVAEGVDDGDGLVAAGEPQAQSRMTASQRDRFINRV